MTLCRSSQPRLNMQDTFDLEAQPQQQGDRPVLGDEACMYHCLLRMTWQCDALACLDATCIPEQRVALSLTQASKRDD